ncbi:MAG: hypothetical protein KC457_29985, partial [Myxococcales bacterium]|nr:hypothetical protein [Myxococcales bacterium]
MPARVGFRFLLAYLILYVIPDTLWAPFVPKLGALFGVEVLYRTNGSGDTTYNYVLLFAYLGVAAIVCLIWSLLDRRRRAYSKLAGCATIGVRYYLAAMMLGYGFAKVFLTQFPTPGLASLIQPLGNGSPMGLAWTFTGFSPAYQFFAGALEVLGGSLLLSRRTTTLGALVCTAVMSNVVMLNYCFDVPVKLFSSHLLAMAIGLAALDARRLLDVLIRNRPVEPKVFAPHFTKRKLHIGSRVLKVVVILLLVGPTFVYGVQNMLTYGPGRPRSPLYGIYEVGELREDGALRPGLLEDGARWRYLVFDSPTVMSVQTIDGGRDSINALRFSPDGALLAGVGADGVARVWDPQQGALVASLDSRGGDLQALAWSVDGELL